MEPEVLDLLRAAFVVIAQSTTPLLLPNRHALSAALTPVVV